MVSTQEPRPLWVWENEGGSQGPKPDKPPPPKRRRPQDTSAGCNAMAAADMARAALEAEGWARIRYEHSAVMWSRRAQWLLASERRRAPR